MLLLLVLMVVVGSDASSKTSSAESESGSSRSTMRVSGRYSRRAISARVLLLLVDVRVLKVGILGPSSLVLVVGGRAGTRVRSETRSSSPRSSKPGTLV